MGPALAQSPSWFRRTIRPPAYPPWYRTPHAASALPFDN
jgi:hypothetical protein